MEMLCAWAETIILVAGELLLGFPEHWKDKLLVWDVGADVYFRGFERELIGRYEVFLGAYAKQVAA